MSLPYNPFLDPNFINGPVRPGLNGTVQAAPQPQQPQQPQLPPGVGEFLVSMGQAYQNQGLAAPGHGRNQTIADRADIERRAAATQRTAFNEAFPRGRGADGLMPVPQIDFALMAQGEANRRAGGDRRRMLGDNNVPANQPQVGFQQVGPKSSHLIGLQAPPQSLGGVLTPQRPPAYTGRGGDFRDPRTGAVSGLINYNAPDGEKYKDSNVWTAGPIPESDPRGPGIYDTEYQPPAKRAEMERLRDEATGKRGGPIAPSTPRFTPVAAGTPPPPPPPPNLGLFLQGLREQAGLAFPQAPEVSTMPREVPPATPAPPAPPAPSAPPTPSPAPSTSGGGYTEDENGYVNYSGYPRWQTLPVELVEMLQNSWNWLQQPQGSNK